MLIVTVGALACAIPLQHVAETMRPLPIEPVAGTPGFIRGLSVIRGAAVPVVDLKALLEPGERGSAGGRFVTLKVGERRVAIAVDAVIGARSLDHVDPRALPQMLGDVAGSSIEAIGVRDAQLLVVLRAARLIPDEVWATLAAAANTR